MYKPVIRVLLKITFVLFTRNWIKPFLALLLCISIKKSRFIIMYKPVNRVLLKITFVLFTRNWIKPFLALLL